jgi:hypothetical protein
MKTLQEQIARARKLVDTPDARLHVEAESLIFDHLKAYVAMCAAEAAGDFAGAAAQCDRMMELRKKLHAISPFYVWPDESNYRTGIVYWGVVARGQYFRSLADMTSGKTGDLVALLPQEAAFRTDPKDDGVFAEWHKPDLSEVDWKPILTTMPLYSQGYRDKSGRQYLGYAWYRLKVNVPASAAGRKITLYAPVVETEAWCWVNGQYVGHRPYREAFIRPAQMEVDVTDAVRPGHENVIAIRVDTALAPAQAAAGLEGRLFLYSPRAKPGG